MTRRRVAGTPSGYSKAPLGDPLRPLIRLQARYASVMALLLCGRLDGPQDQRWQPWRDDSTGDCQPRRGDSHRSGGATPATKTRRDMSSWWRCRRRRGGGNNRAKNWMPDASAVWPKATVQRLRLVLVGVRGKFERDAGCHPTANAPPRANDVRGGGPSFGGRPWSRGEARRSSLPPSRTVSGLATLARLPVWRWRHEHGRVIGDVPGAGRRGFRARFVDRTTTEATRGALARCGARLQAPVRFERREVPTKKKDVRRPGKSPSDLRVSERRGTS
jgi:hypothetical protein